MPSRQFLAGKTEGAYLTGRRTQPGKLYLSLRLEGSSGERRTPRAAGMPGTTAHTHPHQCPPFFQVHSTKPLADGFSGTINAQARFLVTPLIPLLPCHRNTMPILSQLYLRENSFLFLLYTTDPIRFKISRSCSGKEYMRQ